MCTAANPRKETSYPQLLNNAYDIELVFKEKAICPELFPKHGKWIAEFPETSLYLLSETWGRRLIGRIDHNYEGIMTGVRPFGWIKNPFLDDIVFFVVAGDAVTKSNGGRARLVLSPFGANITRGFDKTGPD